MNRFFSLCLVAFLLVGSAMAAPKSRKSPHETINQRLEGNLVIIVYGRPYTNDPNTGKPRQVWGSSLVPVNKIWRLGADEATLLTTHKPIRIGAASVPAGAYTLFFLLGADDSGTLIINREIGQWGIDPYHPDQELARVPMTRGTLSTPVHQFTIDLDKTPDGKGVIRLMWEDREYSVSYSVSK
jgi:hypothetical protein